MERRSPGSSSARSTKSRTAVLLLVESGGVRLHEANAGLIAVSEIMRAVLSTRTAGVPVLVLNGGQYGCFGGMSIVSRLCDTIIMSEEGRMGLSGPEVIENTCGVEEFDSRDRALVWRTVGGKHRYLTGDAAMLVEDDVAAFRAAVLQLLDSAKPDLSLDALFAEHQRLGERLARFGGCSEALDILALCWAPKPPSRCRCWRSRSFSRWPGREAVHESANPVDRPVPPRPRRPFRE